jgi:hypothetical protein
VSLTLTKEELYEITGYKTAKNQRIFFQRLAIPAIVRPDGSLSVSRDHYRRLLTWSPEMPASRHIKSNSK